MHTRLAVVIAALFVLLPASASAAGTYYATPDGGTTAGCPASDPCNVSEALEETSADGHTGDTIIFGAGTYSSWPASQLVNVITGQHLQGAAGARPTLAMGAHGLRLLNNSSGSATLEHVRVTGTSPSIATLGLLGGEARDIVVESSSTTRAVSMDTVSVLRDSVVTSASASAAIEVTHPTSPSEVVLRNVTAVATAAGSAGIRVATDCSAVSHELATVRNTIARGQGADLRTVVTNGPCMPSQYAGFDIDYSNYASTDIVGASSRLIDGGHNQTAPAQTADASIFDGDAYHQLATAPTRDAGVADAQNGPVDPDGDARMSGSAPDIGADEYPDPPAATTGAAGEITTDSELLAGTVSSTAPTVVHFEYGPTAAYGLSTPEQQVDAGQNVAVSSATAGLTPATAYHYRLVARLDRPLQAALGTGVDGVFTTAAIQAPPPPPGDTGDPGAPGSPGGTPGPGAPGPGRTGTTPPALFGKLTVHKTAKIKDVLKKKLTVTLTLNAAGLTPTATLTGKIAKRNTTIAAAKGKKSKKADKVTLHLAVPGKVKSKLTKLKKKLKTTLKVVVSGPGHASQTKTITITLKR